MKKILMNKNILHWINQVHFPALSEQIYKYFEINRNVDIHNQWLQANILILDYVRFTSNLHPKHKSLYIV